MAEKLTKKDKREKRRLEWQEKQAALERSEKIKKFSLWGGAIIIFIAALLGLIKLAGSSQSPIASANIPGIQAEDIVVGNPDAQVTIIEYSDFQCLACASYHPITKQILAEYDDRVNLVVRNFPLTNIHPKAIISAQAAYAAHKQDKFFDMTDLLYGNQSTWANAPNTEEIFADYARQLDLDVDKFIEEMNSNEARDFVRKQLAEATTLRLSYTPTFAMMEKLFPLRQTSREFKKLIEEELQK